MQNLTICVLLALLPMGFGCSVQSVYYRMAAPSGGKMDLSFYIPPAIDIPPAGISGDEVDNVILCIGDGMGFNHVALARHYSVGADKKLYMELLSVSGQVTTHSANNAVTDSAAATTAMACGVKTDNGMIGMNPDKTAYSSILELLDKKGWRTGLVATSSISHATPAGFASHVDSRDKEKDIAAQLLDNQVDVLLGGGRKYWSDELLEQAAAEGYQVVDSRRQFMNLEAEPAVGLFAADGMTTFAPEPSVAEMAQTAIRLLSSPNREWFAPHPKFFLMIEGSQIDWAAHANDTERIIRQMLLFDMAVREAVEFAQRNGHTLVIVTADHETGGLRVESNPAAEGGLEVKWTTGSHTAANVPIYAYGPGSEKFAGTLDNTDIPKRIAAVTGVVPFPTVKADQEIKTFAK